MWPKKKKKRKPKTLPATPYAIALDAAYHTRKAAEENRQRLLETERLAGQEEEALFCKEYWSRFIPKAVRRSVEAGHKGIVILCLGTPVHKSVLTDLRGLGYGSLYRPGARGASDELLIFWENGVDPHEMGLYKAENPID